MRPSRTIYVLSIVTVLSLSQPAHAQVNNEEIRCAAAQLLELTEGSVGALVMVVAGIGTVVSSAFGGYRAATSLMVVAIGAFTLRSFVEIFFEDVGVYDARCWKSSSTEAANGIGGVPIEKDGDRIWQYPDGSEEIETSTGLIITKVPDPSHPGEFHTDMDDNYLDKYGPQNGYGSR